MEFLNEYHLAGLFIGICTFLIIGLFHPVVVKAEYYWGTKCWWIFLILGIGGVIASLSIDNVILSSLLGVFAFSSFWTIKEVFEQEERVRDVYKRQGDSCIRQPIPTVTGSASLSCTLTSLHKE